MSDRAGELTAALASAEAAITGLSETVDVHQSTLQRVKVAFALTLIGLALDLTLTVLVGYGLSAVDHSQGRITELQQQLQAETDRNRAAQCAQNKLLLQFASRSTVNPSYTDEQRAQQVRAAEILRGIVADLRCQ